MVAIHVHLLYGGNCFSDFYFAVEAIPELSYLLNKLSKLISVLGRLHCKAIGVSGLALSTFDPEVGLPAIKLTKMGPFW